MTIYVKSIKDHIITQADASETVDNVKARIEEIEGIPVADQHLLFGVGEMESGKTLSDYNIQQDSVIRFVLYMNGGRDIRNPKLRCLAMMHLLNKKICRRCYGQLPANATRCFKEKCGRTSNIRRKRTYERFEKYKWQCTLSEWNRNSEKWYGIYSNR